MLPDFLQMVSLLTDQDQEETDAVSPITLMTIHAAQGLEFRAVFVVGLEENLFPSEMAAEEGNIEEERRLFYVAITRAIDRLYLTWSHSRMRFGRFENNQRSRFLPEIDSRYLTSNKKQSSLLFGSQHRESQPRSVQRTIPTPESRPALRPVRAYQSSYTSQTPLPQGNQLSVGTCIEHPRFGIGTIMALEGTGLDTKATVDFENAGRKQLLLRFAKFTIKK